MMQKSKAMKRRKMATGRKRAVKLNRVLCLLLMSLVVLLLPGTGLGDSGQAWQDRETACHGDLDCMLRFIENGAVPRFYRTTRSPESLFKVLASAGRFQALGLTPEEGLTLIRAVFNRLEQDPAGMAPEPAESKMLPATLEAPAFSYLAGQEFQPLKGVLLRWPSGWNSQLDEWATMIKAMDEASVTVYVWVNSFAVQKSAMAYLDQVNIRADHIVWVVKRTNSIWMRDYGPQFIYSTEDDQWGVVDFHYYPGRALDDRTPLFISRVCRVPLVDRQTGQTLYTEGGNLNHDGLGTVVFSTRTYANNPGLTQATVDQRILSAFQANQCLVPQDPSLDGTGHVDMFMKIVKQDTVLVGQYGLDQIDYQVLEDCTDLFLTSDNGAGSSWKVVRIPQPDVYYSNFVLPVVRTYTNSLIVNNVIIMPAYNIPEDHEAEAVYRQLFPDKFIVPINAEEIIESGGAWHCVAMEFPDPLFPGLK